MTDSLTLVTSYKRTPSRICCCGHHHKEHTASGCAKCHASDRCYRFDPRPMLASRRTRNFCDACRRGGHSHHIERGKCLRIVDPRTGRDFVCRCDLVEGAIAEMAGVA